MKVICPSIECKHNGLGCLCAAEEIELSSHSVMTVWEGRQEFWRCKNYELSDEAKSILDQLYSLSEDHKL